MSRWRRSGMLWGALAGALLGLAAQLALGSHPALDAFLRYVAQPVGQVFLRLLFMLVVPLIVSALALGVAGLGDLRSLGRVGAKTLAYTVVVSGIAVLLGLAAVNLLRPGDGISPELRERLVEGAADRAAAVTTAPAPASGLDLLLGIVPDNPVRAAAEGQMLAVIFFALMLGIGIALTPTPGTERFQEVLQGLFDVSMRLLDLVLALAPIGVAALLFDLAARLGLEAVTALGRYVAVVLLALAVHQFGVYSLAVLTRATALLVSRAERAPMPPRILPETPPPSLPDGASARRLVWHVPKRSTGARGSA